MNILQTVFVLAATTLLPYAAAQPLRHQPGTQFDYAMGHILAGRCIEVAMGSTLTEIMQDEIFGPLGMDAAGWGVYEADARVLPMYRYMYIRTTPSALFGR